MAKNEYLMRNNKVWAYLHYSICKPLSNETTHKWYTHAHTRACAHTHTHTHTHTCVLKPVYEQEDVKVLWNQAVHTDREVTTNRPDIIKNKKEKTCILIDVAIPVDRNVVQKDKEKKLK